MGLCFSSFLWAVIFLFSSVSVAQTGFSVYWNMQSTMPALSTGSNFQVSELTPGNNFGNTQFLSSASTSSGAYSGASGELNAALASRTGPLEKGSNGSAYVSFSVTAAPGYRLNITSVQLAIRSTTTGPQVCSLFSNTDAFNTPILSQPILPNGAWQYIQLPVTALQPKSSLEFRLYGYNGVGTAAINVANWRLDDLRIEGAVMPESLPVQWQYSTISSFPEFVQLEWGTTAEQNCKGFTICRSHDGSHYTPIAFISSRVNNDMNVMNRYKFIDSFPPAGSLFYKLLQVDWDGVINEGVVRYCFREFSATKSAQPSNFKILATSFCFTYPFVGEATFYLYSIGGAFLGRTTRCSNFNQDVAIQIDVSTTEFKSGTYLLVVQQKGRIFSKKIAVIK